MINIVMVLILVAILYPTIYIVSASFSSPGAVFAGRVMFWPVEPSIDGYIAVFKNKDILIGYRNSGFYTLTGTCINIAATLITAYPLSRRDLPFRGFFMFLFTFTMFFSGGMIPNYMLMRSLGFIDNAAVMLIPGAISIYNMIITRTFMQSSIPVELLEASQMDGCSDFRYFFRIVLPLSKAIIAVIALYYAVGHWNAYFNAFIYLNKRNLFPLQLFLREIILTNNFDPTLDLDPETMLKRQGLADLMKYSLLVVATIPVLSLYPFAQKYFIRGVMIGSLKG